MAHPGRAVGLLEPLAVEQVGVAAVEDADVVHAQEAPLEGVAALDVLAVDPPGEVEQQLVEDLLEEVDVAPAGQLALDLVDPPGRAGVDRRIDVAEVPLVGRELAVGVHVPLAAEQDELPLGPLGVDPGQGDAVEGRVPGGEPGVLPLVGHRQDVERREVAPARRSGPPVLLGGGGGPAGSPWSQSSTL